MKNDVLLALVAAAAVVGFGLWATKSAQAGASSNASAPDPWTLDPSGPGLDYASPSIWIGTDGSAINPQARH